MQCYHPPCSGVKDDRRGGARGWGDKLDAATAAETETAHSLLRIAKGGAPASSNFETQPPPVAWATRPDLQYTDKDGMRQNIEYERSPNGRGDAHAERIQANDPASRTIIKYIP